VPGDRLALAVGVGSEDELLGAFHGPRDFRDVLGAARVDLPHHLEVGIRINRAVLGGQIADMAEGGQDLVALSQIFVDGLRFRRRFDDNDFHGPTFS
jgi:hypothetical protein